MKDELDKVTKNYGSSASAEFPAFKFEGRLADTLFSFVFCFSKIVPTDFIEPVLESIEADKLDVSKL